MKKHERTNPVTAKPTSSSIMSPGKATPHYRTIALQSTIVAALITVLLAVSVGSTCAVEVTPSKGEMLRTSHQAGVRLGVWSNSGDTPIEADSVGSFRYIANVKSASFYAEVYLGIRLMRPLMLELSAGITNRGDVTVRDDMFDYYGNISLYPVNVRLKLYPFAATRLAYQPYLMAGGGLHIGKNNIQFSNDYYAAYNERSLTDLNFVFGGGLDWPIATKVALDFQAAYLPMTFSKDLFGANNYSGVTITVGVKYLLPTLRGKKH